ncbi:Beta-lactamase class A [Arthrobacter sp. ok909]|uniref:serine hydrolase n=1 Tax=Arthrobacter sp. ok909 TaxID=1761746 RepID=UPI00088AD341|nr:serine hydrolase [Arthrobacter sp. ok909]SDP40028.1 Beta-lactamase class A [Arthrobacter sp. ok909]
MAEPARHYGSGGHRAADGSKPGPWPLAWRVGRIRPQYLTAAAVAVALAVTGSVYASGQAGMPGIPDEPAAAAAAAASGTAVTAPLTAQASPAVTDASQAAAPDAAEPETTDLALPAPTATAAPSVTTPAKIADEPVAAVTVPTITPELGGQINAIIAANSAYALGVSLIDVSDGVVHGYGVQGNFVAASTAKILAASAYYHLVETGRASLSAPLGGSTAGVQIRQMVQQSNNDSWLLILRAVGQRRMTDYAASIGIGYDFTVNLLTPEEMARTLYLLYTGQLLNARNTAQLLSYMQNTNYETLIPPAVPPGIGVHHKYGLLFGNLHDASVLDKDGRAFVFVVYTRGRDYSDMGPRTAIIQQLTRTVTAALF